MEIKKIQELLETKYEFDDKIQESHEEEEEEFYKFNGEYEPLEYSNKHLRLEKRYKDFLKNEWASAKPHFEKLIAYSDLFNENKAHFYSSNFLGEIQNINKNSEDNFLAIEESKNGDYFSINSYSNSDRSYDTGLLLHWSKTNGYVLMNESNPRNKLLISNILKYLQGNFDLVIKNRSWNYFNVKQ